MSHHHGIELQGCVDPILSTTFAALTPSPTFSNLALQDPQQQQGLAARPTPRDVYDPIPGLNCTYEIHCQADTEFVCEWGMGCDQLIKPPRCKISSDSQTITMSQYASRLPIDPEELWTELSMNMMMLISHSATATSTSAPTTTATDVVPTATQTGGGKMRAAHGMIYSSPTIYGFSTVGDIVWGVLMAWGISSILLLVHFL
ncbi:unnamed protein product [Periconia digitata]|uniref:Uncharacterized protein n=1 Tax=Periconia digitata TaxID=1303443 RepID=A0A9W4UQ78_9PLEO|nr:unnamed protein product [Periconia digitata]